LRPRDEEQLRLRLHEVEAEAERLRAALGEPRKIGGPDRLIHTNSGQYKQIAEILDASADAIISVNERGLISRFNRGAESTFGYRSSEIIGRPLDILIPDRFRVRHRAHIMKFDRTDDNSRLMNERGEIFGLHKNGAEFPAEASIVKLKNGNSLVFTVILRDITERKEAETALRESEAQLRQAQTMSRIGAMVWDEITDCCEYCSNELAAILGSTPETLIKASRSSGWVQERIHPDDRDEYNAVVTKARETATPYDVEFRFLHNDGHLIHLREMGEPETDAQGRVVRTFGTMQDITDIRQTEESLQQSESLLRQAQKLARLGVFVWDDVTDMCMYCSEELAEMFSLTPAEFIAQRGTDNFYLSFVHPDDRERMRMAVQKGIENSAPYDIEYRAYNAKGEVRHFREITEPIVNDHGRQIRTFGTLQDVTHLRQAEEALRQSEEQFRSLIETSIQGVVIHRDFTPIFANQAIADIFGYDSPEEIMALGSYIPMVADEERQRLESFKQARIENGDAPERYEFRGLRKDGSQIWLENRVNIVKWGGAKAILSVMVDITERKTAEEALLHREAELRTITDNIPAAIVYMDNTFCYRFVNRLAEGWYARTSAEIAGQHGRDVLGDEDFEFLLPRFEAALAGKSVRFEEVRRLPDGVERSLDMSYVPDVGADGQVKGLFALLLDITGRRRAESALRRTMLSGDLLRQIATAANEAPSAEKALAVCLEAISRHGGWHLADVFVLADDVSGDMAPAGLWWSDNPNDFTKFRQSTENTRFAPGTGLPGRVAMSGKPAWIADIHKDKNFPRAKLAGDMEVASGFAFPVLVGQKVTAVLEFFSRDIRENDDNLMDVAIQAGTILGRVIERQRAERALRDSEEQIRLMTDNVPVLITYIDQKKTFRFINKTTEKWYARPKSELVGRPLRNLIGKSQFTKMEQRLDRALAGETLHFMETLTYPDGMTRQIDTTYVPHFNAQGMVRGIFTMVVDITDRIQAEEQLRHAQRLEVVGKLTGGVAHDFNNLLAVIMGNSEIVRDRLGEADPAVRAISNAAMRGSELTQRLLSFSRQQPLRPRAADLAALTREIAGMLSRTLGETIAIKVKSPNRPWLARVDTGELENAVLNLAINARDAMPAGGTLTIETANVTLGARQATQFENARPGKFVRLSLIDTGTGMSAETIDHAFEPFYTTKPFGEGSGLGLSMVYGFAIQSGGFATIESRQGKGATVSLYLPRAEGKDEPGRDCRPLCQPASKGGSIMVIEDDPDVRQLTVTLLTAMGYTVLQAEDGESALSLIMSDRHIDLLLSDVVLPGNMSGPAIAEAALKKRPDLRIMFMSGYAEDVIRRDREGSGNSVNADLLPKPFTRAQLARKVQISMGTDEG